MDFLARQGWAAATFASGNRIRFLVPRARTVDEAQWQGLRALAQGPLETTEATLEDIFTALGQQAP